MTCAQQMNTADQRYAFWYNAQNGAAVLAAWGLVEMECSTASWRLGPVDVRLGCTLTYADQVSTVTAIIGERTWGELSLLKNKDLLTLEQFYERLCDAITRPYRPWSGCSAINAAFQPWCFLTTKRGKHAN